MESTWVVNWDNHEVGWVSAAGDARLWRWPGFAPPVPPAIHIVKVSR
jgi:hypothetical protein